MCFWFKHLLPIYITSQFSLSQFIYAEIEYYFFYLCINISKAVIIEVHIKYMDRLSLV